MRTIAAALCGLGLAACTTTTSFAPPDIPIRNRATDTSVIRDCAPVLQSPTVSIGRNVDGALALTDNFIIGYRCSMRAAADGRQPWEILSFLSLVGSSLATALGAGTDVAIIGGSANAVFTAGRTYYAPQEQTEILNDAVDALLCIQTESVGISAFTVQAAARNEETTLQGMRSGSVAITVETQYFNMVAAALMSVERVTAQRLSRRGSFDAAGVAAEIEKLAQKLRDAEQARRGGPQPLTGAESLTREQRLAIHLVQNVQLDLDVLRPKLDQCVIRAKI